MPPPTPDFESFKKLVEFGAGNVIPVYRQMMSDLLTPVLAYRRLVRPDDRMAPSFLFESVVGGERVGRYSFLGSQPDAQVIARGHQVHYIDSNDPSKSRTYTSDDPVSEMAKLTEAWKLTAVEGLPDFTGGWVGYAGYDVVRYLEGESLPNAPEDDRQLADMHMHLYRRIVVFDNVLKSVLLITHAVLDEYDTTEAAYDAASQELDQLVDVIKTPAAVKAGQVELVPGEVVEDDQPSDLACDLPAGNMTPEQYMHAVNAAKEYIAAGDIFQVVLSQRFELETKADPFDVFRALRVVNPSPYMIYLQAQGCILVGSSPEILCRVHHGEVTNRPLAGTRRRGRDQVHDKALEDELLADPKERAEQVSCARAAPAGTRCRWPCRWAQSAARRRYVRCRSSTN
jgi:anthranilate synthase component 1